MTETTPGAPAPKKRSLFKRAAWQDAPKVEGEDIFSHANEFSNIVAERHRLQAENQKEAEEEKKQKQATLTGRKRRKASDGLHDEGGKELKMPGSGSGSSARVRMGSKARSRTPISPSHAYTPALSISPDSLAGRYETLAQSTASRHPSRTEPLVIDLGDSDDSFDDDLGHLPSRNACGHGISARPSGQILANDDDEPEDILDPTLAALAARARERAADNARIAAVSSSHGFEAAKAPVAQLFISPEIPDSKPLMVKVRIDSTLARTRLAWCEKQGFSAEKAKDVYFTWKDTRVYDSTTVKRLGIQVDGNGNVSVDGDSNIYDDINLPKVHVQAWTDALFQQHKREQAVAAAAKKKAAEPQTASRERTSTPEPAPKVKKIRLIMKAKGKEDFRLSVNPVGGAISIVATELVTACHGTDELILFRQETTFGHIADAYKQSKGIERSQPITLMFDGERLVPMDSIIDSEVEDMDSIDVLFK